MDSLTEDIAAVAQRLDTLIHETRQRQQRAGIVQTFSSAELTALTALQSKAHVDIPRPLGWPGWPTELWLVLVSLLQRLSHRFIAWMLVSLVAQQNQFNAAGLRTVQILLTELADERNAQQQWRVAQEVRLAQLQAELERLQEAIDEARR